MIKNFSVLLLTLCGLCFRTEGQHRDYPIQAIPFTKVKLADEFWLPRIKINHTVTIPASFARCERTGRVKNFEMAAARSGEFCTVYPFDDTDIYKTIEGASYSLSLYPDKPLELYIDTLITKIEAAQEPDGYLYTARTINPAQPHKWAGTVRWEKERELSHELYNAGHLYEAAAAHYQATGKRTLLDIAIRNADLVCSVFGPGKRHVAPGHQVIEMGLVKLYRITGKEKYLLTAKDFVDERGHFSGYDPTSNDPWKNGAYWQDHLPVIEQKEATGHAVRAGYLYSAMADIAALTGDAAYVAAIDTIWNNVVSKKMYVQGGIGAVHDGERFGENYDLPNATAYNETCAAISNVYWNHRMFLLHGESKYIDILEKSLYNGLISGVGLDGKSFFYTNTLEIKDYLHDGEAERSGWFTCSCCPTNITRLIPSVPGYVYAQKDNSIFVNLFISGSATIPLNKNSVQVEQKNNYPWDGNLTFTITPERSGAFEVLIRIPGWANGDAIPSDLYKFSQVANTKTTITLNGKPTNYTIRNGYAVLSRTWRKGDIVQVNLPMEVQRVVANPLIKEDLGKVALQRGPLTYCAEWADNNGKVSNLILPAGTSFTTEFRPNLLNGVTVIEGDAVALKIDSGKNSVFTEKRRLTAIPYYAWANRGKGEMIVWFPERITNLSIISK